MYSFVHLFVAGSSLVASHLQDLAFRATRIATLSLGPLQLGLGLKR
jgi:hypothetical protein